MREREGERERGRKRRNARTRIKASCGLKEITRIQNGDLSPCHKIYVCLFFYCKRQTW